MQYPSTLGDHNYALKNPIKSRVDSCFVPMCPSTSTKFPNKLFLTGPTNPKLRKKWFQVAKRCDYYSPKTVIRCCEDHFDIENDIANYRQYIMGFSRHMILKDKVLPSKFHCQPDRIRRMRDTGNIRHASVRRQRKKQIEDINRTIATNDPTDNETMVDGCIYGCQSRFGPKHEGITLHTDACILNRNKQAQLKSNSVPTKCKHPITSKDDGQCGSLSSTRALPAAVEVKTELESDVSDVEPESNASPHQSDKSYINIYDKRFEIKENDLLSTVKHNTHVEIKQEKDDTEDGVVQACSRNDSTNADNSLVSHLLSQK